MSAQPLCTQVLTVIRVRVNREPSKHDSKRAIKRAPQNRPPNKWVHAGDEAAEYHQEAALSEGGRAGKNQRGEALFQDRGWRFLTLCRPQCQMGGVSLIWIRLACWGEQWTHTPIRHDIKTRLLM